MRSLLEGVAKGETSVEEALLKIKFQPFEEIEGMAVLDSHRGVRQGMSEVIYGAGKTPEQIDTIAHALYGGGQKSVLITRMSSEAADYFHKDIPFTYHPDARIGIAGEKSQVK